jgi:hypothetical protein
MIPTRRARSHASALIIWPTQTPSVACNERTAVLDTVVSRPEVPEHSVPAYLASVAVGQLGPKMCIVRMSLLGFPTPFDAIAATFGLV